MTGIFDDLKDEMDKALFSPPAIDKTDLCTHPDVKWTGNKGKCLVCGSDFRNRSYEGIESFLRNKGEYGGMKDV